MQRLIRASLGLALLLGSGLMVRAQDATTEPTPLPLITPALPAADLNALVADANAAADRAEAGADAVDQGVERAFNLLGIFEAIGFFVTIVAAVGGAAGIFQLFNARAELAKTREQLAQEAKELRDRFEDEIKRREADLSRLEDTLLEAARTQSETTYKALIANALMPMGERQYKAADYTGALNTYMRARELDPNNPVVNQRLGYVYTQRGDLDMAKQHYENAILQEPNFAPALAGLGFVYRRLGEMVDKRIPQASEIERLERIVERDQLFNRAEDLLLQALKISPRLVDDDGESWWGVVGGLYKRRGQIDQAIEAYRQVTVVTPESSYGFGNLALLYLKRNRLDDMLKTYERVEKIAATEAMAELGNFWAYADLVVARYALGKSDLARDVLPLAMTLAPVESPYMLSGMAETLEELLNILPVERKPAIVEAITLLRNELAARAPVAS